MNLTSITNPNNMTYEYYLKQPKSMLEWRLIEKLSRNLNLIKAFDRTHSDPLTREKCQIDPAEKQNLYIFNLGVNQDLKSIN